MLNRTAQGMPVNTIVIIAIALLVLVVVGAFFISGFTQASASIETVDKTQAECQSICQNIIISAFSYKTCAELDDLSAVTAYDAGDCPDLVGPCPVTIRGGAKCSCTDACIPDSD